MWMKSMDVMNHFPANNLNDTNERILLQIMVDQFIHDNDNGNAARKLKDVFAICNFAA